MDLAETTFLAAALHAGLLLASARSMPALEDVAEDGITQSSYWFHGDPIPTVEPDEADDTPPATTPAERDPDGRQPTDSRCGGHRGGSMGDPSAKDRDLRYGVWGPADNPDPHIARVTASQEARELISIGLAPKAPLGGDPDAPTMPWGREDDLGTDPGSARGHMWSEDFGAAFGSPGVGVGLRRICPTCGDDGRGAEARREDGTGEGGATGTARAALPR